MTCHEIHSHLAALADDDPGPTPEVRAHVATCVTCQAALQAQITVRSVLKARAPQLALSAPPGLRTRLAAAARGPAAIPALGWPGRLSAVAAALVVVLAVGGAVLPLATVRSATLLAAQLALDHIKCFVIDGDADGAPIAKAEAESTLLREYGFSAKVPDSLPAERFDLLAVRHCLYGDGLAAHVLYRVNGEPVSLFILPRTARTAEALHVMGHEELSWTRGDRTYMLVAGVGTAGLLARVAPHVRDEAQ
jgi:anti-sigma factor RsiW